MTVQRNSARRDWFIVGGIMTIAVIGVGVFFAWQLITGAGLGQQTEQTTVTSPGTPQIVSVDGTSANVELRGTQTEDVIADLDLTWYSSEPVVDAIRDDPDLVVDLYCRHTGVPIWFAPGCSIDYAAQVPHSAGATVDLVSGAATIQNLDGDVDVFTISGNISVTDVAGSVEASSTSGHIDLEFSEVVDRVAAETVSGTVQITVPQGESYRVLTNSTSGRISVEVATDPASSHVIDLTTTSGTITVSYSD